jgi:hypothetical protein
LGRREKIFWLVVGAIFVVGFIALIPAHGEICKESQKTGEEACTSYRLVPFLVIEIGKILDALGVAITALATMAIAWFTWSLRRSTDRLWDADERQLKLLADTSAVQSRDTQSSIAEALRAATAMENVAATIQGNAAIQLRAYVSVLAGAIIEQAPGLNFEFQPGILNAGFTPAYDVIVYTKVDILPYPLPADFDFSLPEGPEPGVGVLGFQQRTFGIGTLNRRLSEQEIAEIKRPGGRRIYNYGRVTYRDLFGRPHYTNFCFYTVWGTQAPVCLTTSRHNDAD